MWSKSQGYPAHEQLVISQQPIQPYVDQVIEPMRSLVNTALPSKSDLHQVVEPI